MTLKRTRCRYTTGFAAEVVLAALTEYHLLADLAARYHLATAQITRWKKPLHEEAVQVFAEAPPTLSPVPDAEPLYAAIGQLQVENALLKNAGAMSVTQQQVLVQATDLIDGSVAVRC